MIIQDTMYKSVQVKLLRPIPVIKSIPVSECTPWIELCICHFGLTCIYFPGFKLTCSNFNIVPSVTFLSPLGCWFSLCTSGRCLGTPHNFVLFFFFFFFCFFLIIWSSLSSWALHSHTAKQQYRLQCWTDLSSNWDKGVLYCTEKWKSHSKHCCCCCQLSNFKITFNRN